LLRVLACIEEICWVLGFNIAIFDKLEISNRVKLVLYALAHCDKNSPDPDAVVLPPSPAAGRLGRNLRVLRENNLALLKSVPKNLWENCIGDFIFVQHFYPHFVDRSRHSHPWLHLSIVQRPWHGRAQQGDAEAVPFSRRAIELDR